MAAVAKQREPNSETGGETDATARVEAARAGDRRAFAALYRDHARTIHGVLLARLPRAELRDAMQEVFTVALTKLGDLRDPSAFSPWLASIARNLARDWHKRHRELSRPPERLDDERGASRGLDDALDLLEAMRELPEGHREILVLRFVEGMTGPEIAAAVGLTPGSVRVKLHRAVTMLRQQIRHEEGEDE
jgi:RNA polymerase sigma-70 factor (ECF subfamily)